MLVLCSSMSLSRCSRGPRDAASLLRRASFPLRVRLYTMKIHHLYPLPVLFCLLLGMTGCFQSPSAAPVIAEGVIYSVEYTLPDGSSGGLTRSTNSAAVPGGNGSWGVDAYGQLTANFLIITRPDRKNLGPRIIPTRRLVEVQFGDGGIKTVDPKTGGTRSRG